MNIERESYEENMESNKERLNRLYDEIIELAKDRGAEDTEVKERMIKWTEEQEQRAEKLNDPVETIRVNARRARLYYDLGFKEAALENFESAREQALNEYRDEIYWIITDEMVEKKLIEEEDEEKIE